MLTPSAAATRTSGATLRADEVVEALRRTDYAVERTTLCDLDVVSGTWDLGVVVSYACSPAVRTLRGRSRRLWLDAVDSWLLVNGSGLRRGHPLYFARAVRDASRLARTPAVDLVTWISGADLRADRGTVRGRRALVLPGWTPPAAQVGPADGRRVVLAGDWDYPPNRDALRWFCSAVLPRLEAALPGASWRVDVHGAGTPQDCGPRVRLRGYADDPADLYRAGDVHAAPVRFGGGVKRKVLQPLLAGLPVVTTPAGAHGLREHPRLDVRADAAGIATALAARLQAPPVVHPVALAHLLDRDDTAEVITWLCA